MPKPFYCLPLLLIAACLCAAATAQEAKVPHAGGEGAVRTLAEWAPAFSEPGGPVVKIAPALAEQRLGVFGKLPDPKTLREVAARLLEYDWTDTDPAHGGQLTLTQSRERKGLAARKRAAAERAGVTVLRERINALRAVLDGKSTVQQWAQKYPEDARKWDLPATGSAGQRVAGGESAPIREGSKDHLLLFKLLNTRDVELLLQTGVWMSGRVGEAGTPLGDYVRAAFPHNLATLRIGGQVVTAKDPYENAGVDYRVLLSLYGDDGRLGIRENVVDVVPHPLPPPPPEDPSAVINRASPTRSAIFLLKCPEPGAGHLNPEADPRLQKRVSIKEAGLGPGPQSSVDGFQGLARASGLTLVTDDFAETRLRRYRYEGPDEAIRVSDLLDQMTRAYHYTWRLDGDLLLLRQADWFFAEEREIPANVVAILTALTSRGDGTTFKEQAELAARLTRPQFENIPAYAPTLAPLRFRHNCLYLFQSFSEQQQAAALSPDGLPFPKLVAPQQNAFLEVIRSEWPIYMLEPPAARASWGIHLLQSPQPRAGWHLFYGFGDQQMAVFIPAFHAMKSYPGQAESPIRPEYHPVL